MSLFVVEQDAAPFCEKRRPLDLTKPRPRIYKLIGHATTSPDFQFNNLTFLIPSVSCRKLYYEISYTAWALSLSATRL